MTYFCKVNKFTTRGKNNTQLNRKNVIINCKKYYVQR